MDENACPISGHASALETRLQDSRQFNCPECGRFRVSGTALHLFEINPNRYDRRGLLAEAKCRAKPGEIPLISNIE